jgi:hypothetical protein
MPAPTLRVEVYKIQAETQMMAGMAYAKVEVGWRHACMRNPQTLCITHTLMNFSVSHVHCERQSFSHDLPHESLIDSLRM